MTLSEKQQAFALAVAKLILKASELGYGVTFADAYRDPRVFGEYGIKQGYGRAKSNHKIRLAVDLNLFRDGVYLTKTEDHLELGTWWEEEFAALDSRWGGRWEDGNHYSFEHWGTK